MRYLTPEEEAWLKTSKRLVFGFMVVGIVGDSALASAIAILLVSAFRSVDENVSFGIWVISTGMLLLAIAASRHLRGRILKHGPPPDGGGP